VLGPARFARDYAGARDRFLEAPARSGGLMRGVELSAPGPAGESLGTDVLLLGDSGARKVLIVLSGTHGVEGFAGSGCLSTWLEAGHAENLPPATGTPRD